MNNTARFKKFLGLLENSTMRDAIDLFVYQYGFGEFIKVKKTLNVFKDYAAICTEMQEVLWQKKDNTSWVETSEGIFHFVNLRLDGDYIDLPLVYIETFPPKAKLYFVD